MPASAAMIEPLTKTMQVRIVLCLALFVIVQTAGLAIYSSLRRYRVDLKKDQNMYDGASSIPQVNYLSRANYSAEGQRLLRWFWAWHVAWPLTLGAIVWLVFVAA